MSTIVNGYRIFANSLEEAIVELKKPKAIVKDFINTAIFKDELFNIISNFDNGIITKLLPKKYHFNECTVQDIERENSPSKTPLDFTIRKLSELNERGESNSKKMEVILFPEKFVEENKTYYLFLLFSQGETYLEEKKKFVNYGDFYISKLKGAKSYKYWDNTDKPSNISHALWSKRYEEWEKCLPTYNSTYEYPDDMGVSIKIADFNRAITINEKMMNKVLSIDSRVEPLKRAEIFTDNFILENLTDGDQAKILIALRKYKSEDYSQELKEDKSYLLKELVKILPKIDKEYINNSYKNIINEVMIKYQKDKLEDNLTNKETQKTKLKL